MANLTGTSVIQSAGGMKMPIFGLGTWQSLDSDLEKALHAALEAGYHLIDTAALYNNEPVIGKVLSEWFSSGKLKRQDVFITTKLSLMANKPSAVKECLQNQLTALQLDYVDLYLIHSPIGLSPNDAPPNKETTVTSTPRVDMTTDIVALWKEMEKQVDAGLTKAVGVSNFNTKQIERVLAVARIPPANLQIELYLYCQGKAVQEFCREKGITITSYGSLGSPGAPAWLTKGEDLNPLHDPVVARIAKAHKKTTGQVLLRHLLQLGIAVIPKSSNPVRVRENIKVFDFELTAAEMNELNSLDKGEEGRRFVFQNFKSHPEYPFPS